MTAQWLVGHGMDPLPAMLRSSVAGYLDDLGERLVRELGVERFPEEVLAMVRARIDAELAERKVR